MSELRVIKVKQSVLANNDSRAAKLRGELKEKGVFFLNVMSSPGSGKTTLLINLINKLKEKLRIGVIEADMDADKLILSAKEILKEQQANARKKKMSDVKIGQVFTGTVATIKDYGAFIDLGDDLSGLVHISQISHDRIKHPGVVLTEGQEVNVKVTDIKDGKISLSIKALIDNPDEPSPEDANIELPESEGIGTSLGDLLKGFKL